MTERMAANGPIFMYYRVLFVPLTVSYVRAILFYHVSMKALINNINSIQFNCTTTLMRQSILTGKKF